MTSLSVAVLLQASLLTASGEDYADAHRALTETGKPMVVMVGADWCPACVAMKRNVIPQLRSRKVFRKVAFAIVNFDRNRELATELTGGGPIPQLVMYRKSAEGWKRQKLVGGQSVETIESFLSEGVKQSEADNKVQPASHAKRPDDSKPPRSASAKPAEAAPQAS